MDGDGDTDVLSAAGLGDKVAWYENRLDEASADFGPEQLISNAHNGPFSVVAADLDGDGDNDVLSASTWDDKVAWYENRLDEASADFGPQQVISTALIGPHSVVAADFDGDGDADVLSASHSDGPIAWFENRLDEASVDFGPQQVISTVAAFNVFAADFDGDGDTDVLSASWIDDKVAWYENETIACDFDGDRKCNDNDIDALVMEIVTGTNHPVFDVTGDGRVDLADRDHWLTDAGALNLMSGAPYLLGDANLDGVVDVSDFNWWNANKFTQAAQWTKGDFNADGVIDVSDLNLWNAHKFTLSSTRMMPPGSAVAPEMQDVHAKSITSSAMVDGDPRWQTGWQAPPLPTDAARFDSIGDNRVIRQEHEEPTSQQQQFLPVLDAAFSAWATAFRRNLSLA